MNVSAVSDAYRNAELNGIKNCKFICSKVGLHCLKFNLPDWFGLSLFLVINFITCLLCLPSMGPTGRGCDGVIIERVPKCTSEVR